MGAIVANRTFAHAVHYIGHGESGVDIVDHKRATPATPITNLCVGRDWVAWRVEPVTDTKGHADSEHQIASGCLNVKDALDRCRREQINAARRATMGNGTLRERDTTSIAMSTGRGNFCSAPRNIP